MHTRQHQIKPLHTLEQETEINPITDLACLCSNCHRIIHRKKDEELTIDDLRKIYIRQKDKTSKL